MWFVIANNAIVPCKSRNEARKLRDRYKYDNKDKTARVVRSEFKELHTFLSQHVDHKS